MICIVKSVTEDYSLLQRGVARNGKFKPRLDIGPLGNGCFISRISVVQLRWASLRNAVLWQNFAAAVVAPSRFSFNVNEARNQKGGRGGGGRRMKLQMRDDVTRIYFHRDIILPGRPPEEKSLSRRFCNQTDP